ncbi:glycerate kinase [Paenibacillus sp. GCM10023252]|uniref:glycerate kinase n=1 Tax=Paenibacillus sp. GCM10023252 TaxID=3252649 RepID=UPI0036060A68
MDVNRLADSGIGGDRVVIAPDKFKGSLTSAEAAEAMAEGVRRAWPDADIRIAAVADGGEGTVLAVLSSQGGELVRAHVRGPLGTLVEASYALLEDGTAVVEMSAASGLALLREDERNPLITSSRGTGELILDALNRGARRIVLGLGGSATNDGGMGMAQALGFRFLDEAGQELGDGGAELLRLKAIDAAGADHRLEETVFDVCCDVDNPLCGPYGAAAVYAPQKGASADDVQLLDRALMRLSAELRSSLGAEVESLPGAGAAGGMGAGAAVFLRASLRPGFALLAGITRLEDAIASAALVLTGEGLADGQTASGKAPAGVAGLARKHGVPAVCLAGGLGPGADALYAQGVSAMFSIVDGPAGLDDVVLRSRPLLAQAAENVVRLFLAARPRRA